MRTSLNELKAIDDHLFGLTPGPEDFLFEVRLILDQELSASLIHQQQTHSLIRQYARGKLKAEIAAVHQKLFDDTRPHGFAAKILGLFK